MVVVVVAVVVVAVVVAVDVVVVKWAMHVMQMTSISPLCTASNIIDFLQYATIGTMVVIIKSSNTHMLRVLL